MYYHSSSKKKLDGIIDFNLLTCLITVPKNTAEEDISGKINFAQSKFKFSTVIQN
jgi:hypothetical protein